MYMYMQSLFKRVLPAWIRTYSWLYISLRVLIFIVNIIMKNINTCICHNIQKIKNNNI